MADVLYKEFKQKLLGADIDLAVDDIRAMLVLSSYTFDDTDEFVSDLGAVDNGRSAALGSKTVTDGVFDAADSSLTATAASACNALIIFKHTGSDATAALIGYIDFSAFTPAAGQAISLAWNASGILAL